MHHKTNFTYSINHSEKFWRAQSWRTKFYSTVVVMREKKLFMRLYFLEENTKSEKLQLNISSRFKIHGNRKFDQYK